jgi:hypothetical protein
VLPKVLSLWAMCLDIVGYPCAWVMLSTGKEKKYRTQFFISFLCSLYPSFYFCDLGIKHRTLTRLSKCSTIELYSQSRFLLVITLLDLFLDIFLSCILKNLNENLKKPLVKIATFQMNMAQPMCTHVCKCKNDSC